MTSNLMEMLHDYSLPSIELLQASFPNNKDFMINISTLFDPRYVFLIYAPILFAINRQVGHRLVVALTIAEWANQILKWLLAGERPYWYVHERAFELANSSRLFEEADYEHRPLAVLKQFPVTCELGAGSPSGHAMVTATVWYVLTEARLSGELPLLAESNGRHEITKSTQRKLATFLWSVYMIMLALVSLSRVYLACHFPHQCLSGAILGALVAKLVIERLPMEKLVKHHFCLASLAMLATALGTYGLLRGLGVDPLWSVSKAMRWCAKKEYIHLDTTPFFSMMRYLGFCLGAGLAYEYEYEANEKRRLAEETNGNATGNKNKQQQEITTATNGNQIAILLLKRSIGAIAGILFGQFLLALPAPKSSQELFYLISFAIYVLFAYAIAGPIPRLTNNLISRLHETSKLKLKAQ